MISVRFKLIPSAASLVFAAITWHYFTRVCTGVCCPAKSAGFFDTALYNPASPTPNLLRLSKEGIRLDRHCEGCKRRLTEHFTDIPSPSILKTPTAWVQQSENFAPSEGCLQNFRLLLQPLHRPCAVHFLIEPSTHRRRSGSQMSSGTAAPPAGPF